MLVHALHADVALTALERVGQFGKRLTAQREMRLAARRVGDHVNLFAGGAFHMNHAVLHRDLVNLRAAAGVEVAFLQRGEDGFFGQRFGVHHHPAAEAVGLFVLAVRIVAGDGENALAFAKQHVPVHVGAARMAQAFGARVEHLNGVKICQGADLFRLHARPDRVSDDCERVLRAHLVEQVLHAHLSRVALRAGNLRVLRRIRREQADHMDALDLLGERNVALPAGQHEEIPAAVLRVGEHDVVIRQRQEIVAHGAVIRGLLFGRDRAVGDGGVRMNVAFKPLSLLRKS